MAKAEHIYVNLPVADLKRSMNFFTQLGYEFNLDFTNDQGACLVLSDNIFAMLLTQDFFKTFIDKPLSDAKKSTQALICYSVARRQDVDNIIMRAKNAGGKALREAQDHGFMYVQGFEDLDGHHWEVASYEQK